MKKLFLLLWIMTISQILLAQSEPVDSSNILLNGQYLPSFSVVQMDGQTFDSEKLKGKVVLINFFATWCPPCRKELPFVRTEIYDKYHDRKDFVLMIISREEAPEKVTPFIEAQAYPMDFFSDTDRSCYKQFAHQFIPRNYLFNKEGKLIYQSRGFEEQEFGEMLKVLADQLK